jgi:2Fe-2S ferredoxin
MVTIVFVSNDGRERRQVSAAPGESVMRAAVKAGVPGIDADCGGACACATCHVYVERAWRDAIGAPNEMEIAMLEAATDFRPESRLSCQIKIRPEFEGLTLGLPVSQKV